MKIMAWDKSVSQKDAVKAFLVQIDEKFDLKASVAKYEAAALKYIAGQEAESDLIGECLSALFEQHKGATLHLDYIKSHTVQLMSARKPELKEPSLHNMLSGRVEAALHEATGEGKTYAKRLGKGGGFRRIADQSETK